ncbi:O-antigen ligase family protein [Halorubrum aethiopicum]|uniref:O-antigen ligase family protein n=1 Tax=Halorubrum aethiopicum TaxID=1758255 RepID=UPI0009B5BDCF|nr:O-antigen ligase family protein [Halorubrum aethiopicum]
MRESDQWITALYAVFPVVIVFSIQIPLAVEGSTSASINAEDLIILGLGLLFLYDILTNNEFNMKILFPNISLLMGIIGFWIVLTLLIANFRSPEPVTVSVLWTFKWIEILLFFIFVQNQITAKRAKISLKTFFYSGVLLTIFVLYEYLTVSGRTVGTFGNPNVLASVLVLFTLLTIMKMYDSNKYIYSAAHGIISCLSIIAILSTQSRSGVLALVTGCMILFLYILLDLNLENKIRYLAGSVVIFAISLLFISQEAINRITGWITISDGRLQLSDTQASYAFRTRLRLLDKAIELFKEAPLFGYGWFASPSRVGYLDVHYTTLLVELGIVGIVLFAIFYMTILRGFVSQISKSGKIAVLGSAWYCGLIVQAIGGNFPRIPRIMFLMLLFIGIVWALRESNEYV